MGMSVNTQKAGNRRRSRYRPMGDINVTPMVDVMLVLLIVFMVTAPLLTVGVPVDLPKTQAGQVNADQAPLVVTIREDGALFLQDTKIEPDKLIPRLSAIGEANKEVRIFVRGDKNVAYGEVLVLMGRIQSAGFERVALVAELPEDDS